MLERTDMGDRVGVLTLKERILWLMEDVTNGRIREKVCKWSYVYPKVTLKAFKGLGDQTPHFF